MSGAKFERASVVSGLGISRVARRSGRSDIDHTTEAVLAAVADAGLSVRDIDGIATIGDLAADALQDALGLRPKWISENVAKIQLSAFFNACLAVAAGLCRHVLVYRSVQMMGGTLLGNPASAKAVGWGEWLLPFRAYSAANWVALHARRHMHEYGTTAEQLGWVALNSRRHAALNELAAFRDPLTMDDYLASRWVSEPLRLLDCDVPVDGAVAFVVSSADYARDAPNPAIRVEAIGSALEGRPSWHLREDFPAMAAHDAARHLWSRTDLKPADVDVAEIYDGFTFLTLAWLEALGFCGRGESGPFVEDGARIGLGGELPLNTYGGQLSAGRLHGYWLLHEACLQLRGEAGARQVAGAEVALAAAGGGPIGGCVLLTR